MHRSLPGRVAALLLLATVVALAGCAHTAIAEAETLSRSGQYEQAYVTLDAAARADSGNTVLRTALAASRDRVVVRSLAQAELALAGGRIEQAQRVLQRIRDIDPRHPRLAALETSTEQALEVSARLRSARRALDEGRAGEAAEAIAAVLAVQPGHPGARAMQQQLPRPAPPAAPGAAMAQAYQKPITLEFRDAPLRQVFEVLARTSAVNFVFDKDVRPDARITVFLREVTLDEALRVILATQALDRKLLNDSTVLVYPNTAAKQREHQELVTRSFYLANADVKQALALVRTMAKTRDLHADERLNVLVVRDVPEVIEQIEKLLANVDLREPEVMLAVEVMEVASDRVDELGISWPGEVQFGLPNVIGQVLLSERRSFRGSIANPAALLSLRGVSGLTNLLANPTIRARNREKAKVYIGEKLPVFTTTAAVNVGVSASVSYLDVGLKLDVEPSVQRDGEVVIKVALEVSNLIKEVAGPQGSLAYQVGTRLTTTSLRLRDGETQVLAGLINDEDRRRATGIPGLSTLPLVGRLFGVHDEERLKTEIVMLITPRVIWGLDTPDRATATVQSGTDTLPGAASVRLGSRARASVAVGGGGAADGSAEAAAAAAARRAPPPDAAPASGGAAVQLSATAGAAVGETISVTLGNTTALAIEGEVEYDATMLEPVSVATTTPGWVRVEMAAREDAVVTMRVLPAAAGRQVAVRASLRGRNLAGEAQDINVEGTPVVAVAATKARP